MSFSAAFGSFEASHVADVPDVAPHMHHVRLNLSHYELFANYGLRNRMQLFVRAPYDVKDQHVRYSTLDGAPFTPPYGDIHHRTETLTGISDASIGIELAPRSGWTLGLGTTLPTGDTVPDPILLGREGKTHEHIQFGSGTFRPIVSAQWAHPRFVARAEATLSVYENGEGFRAPTTIVYSAGPQLRVRNVSIAPRVTGQYQTIGRWSGEIDEGSGFDMGGVSLQLAMPIRGFVIAPNVYRELWSRSLSGDESFRQGTTFGVAISHTY